MVLNGSGRASTSRQFGASSSILAGLAGFTLLPFGPRPLENSVEGRRYASVEGMARVPLNEGKATVGALATVISVSEVGDSAH